MPEQEQKTTFKLIENLNKPTPAWAKMLFKVWVGLTSVATFIVASLPEGDIDAHTKVQVGIYLKASDMLVLYISQTFGIDNPQPTNQVANRNEPGGRPGQ